MTEASLDDRSWQLPAHTIDELQPRRHDACVCIPVINEGERILGQLADMQQARIGDHADILLLDGGSRDGSTEPQRLRALGVTTLLTKTGPGRLSAQLRMGYAYALRAGYQQIITIDGNRKDGVAAIPALIARVRAGDDLVQGSRFVPGGQAINTPLSRYLAIRLIHAPLLALAARFPYSDTTNGFRGYSRRLLLDPQIQPFRDIFSDYELLPYLNVQAARCGFRISEAPVTRSYPPAGKTPTKIHGLDGYRRVLDAVFGAISGRFSPR
jgi:dolichol-phosphate mannosyltransferase